MNTRTTWVVAFVAAALFGFIYVVRPGRHKEVRPEPVLKNFRSAEVTCVQVRPGGPASLQIRADRTNDTWRLTEPLVYPAQAVSIDNLLAELQRLTPVTRISPAEYRTRPNADEEFGFASPQASIILFQKDYRTQLLIGGMTNPGDQVYLQVVGVQGIYVVDAGLLKVIPHSANDWRDTTFLDVDKLTFDRLAVTNSANAVVLQRDLPNGLWRMVWPLSGARADNERIVDCLHHLKALRIERFVSDDPKADLDAFGLAQPELEIALGRGTNTLALLQFGKSPTNDPAQVFARRAGEPFLFAVAKDLQAAWRKPAYDFRDPHLLSVTEPLRALEMRGASSSNWFRLERQTNDTWRVLPQDFAADPVLVQDLISELNGLRIVQFTKDVVNQAALPEFGLATPARKYILEAAPAPSAPGTNRVVAELQFGFSTNHAVFARRTDETSVYEISTNDFARLASSGWQLRQRKLWDFSIDDVAAVTLRQDGRTRRIIRNGPHRWSLAPGSQGVINDLAVEETVRGLAKASADAWVDKGDQDCARYGLADKSHEVTIELKNGRKASIQFGGEAPSTDRYASVKVDGQLWILEFPWLIYRDVLSYLSVP